MGKFIIKNVPTGVKFDLKARNGEVIATSEVYSTLDACKNGIESVRENTRIAGIEDQTIENFGTLKCPKFEVYEDKAGEYRFRLLAKNGQNIAIGESYTTKQNCLGGIESIKLNAPGAPIEQQIDL
ncbi:MAG: YegP family protein [Clostridia bacterium]